MSRDIKLDGGEISVLKALGTSGSQVFGKILLERMEDMEPAEVIETLTGLVERGYVNTTKVSFRTVQDVERGQFRVNPSYARDLKDALNPSAGRDQRRDRRDRR